MKVSLLLVFLCFLMYSSPASAQILVRADENGKRVFYNLAPKPQPLRATVAHALATRVQDYAPMIEQACSKYKVDPDLVKAVIQVE